MLSIYVWFGVTKMVYSVVWINKDGIQCGLDLQRWYTYSVVWIYKDGIQWCLDLQRWYIVWFGFTKMVYCVVCI